jgi:ABC-type branched-subunit amino acid transport system ATPase component
MRVIDRVVVLDHRDYVFDAVPDAAQSDARVVEVYLGADVAA